MSARPARSTTFCTARLIATYLADAVQWVNRLTQIGILDTPLARECSVASLTAPLLIRHRSQQIKRFQFRAADATDAPCDLADADMLTPCGLGETRVDPPLDGWPATTLHVQYALSTDADATPGGIRNAVIHLTRDMYDMRGGERQGASRTVLDWIAQYRPKAPDEDAVTGVPMPVTLPGSSSVVTLRAGWSTDAAATADELVGQSTGTVITTPAATDPAPHQYLALWRSDVAGGDPTHVVGGVDQRSIFGAASALAATDTAPGQVIVSHAALDVVLFSGAAWRVT